MTSPSGPPYHYLNVQPSDGLVLGVASYDSPMPELDPEAYVLATDEQLAAVSEPGTHYLEEDGTIRTEPLPPPPLRFVEDIPVSTQLRTTDAEPHDVFVLPADPKSVYRAHLEATGLDAGNGACKFMEGVLVWKRLLGTNVIAPPANITVVSDIHDTAAASWIMNGLPSGGSFRIFVQGAAGRTIDWSLTGTIGRFAPDGLDAEV